MSKPPERKWAAHWPPKLVLVGNPLTGIGVLASRVPSSPKEALKLYWIAHPKTYPVTLCAGIASGVCASMPFKQRILLA
jgi:hypothetical protein